MSEIVEHFEEYLAALSGEGELPEQVSARDLQLSIGILLVQALRADLQIRDEEAAEVIRGIEEVLGLAHEEAVTLMRLAAHRALSGDAMRMALERLDRHLTRPQRVEVVEWLWRIAFADAELLAHEEYLVRRVSEMLGLGTADLIEAKVRAKEAL